MSEFYKNKESRTINEEEKTKNFEYSVLLMRWLLQALGAWPLNNGSYPKFLQIFLFAVCSFHLAFLTVPYCLYTFLVEKDVKIRLRLAGPLSFCLMSVLKYWSVIRKTNDIEDTVYWISKDWQTSSSIEERALMFDKARKARYFTVVCATFIFTSMGTYCFTFPYTQDKIVVNNVSMRILTYPCYFIFFDPYVQPVRDIIYFMQTIGGLVSYTVTSAVCCIAIVCILHICGQIAVTSYMLQNLSLSFDNQAFAKIIRKHLRFLKLASKLEQMFNGMCAVEFVGCTFNICMLGYYFITEYDPTNKVAPYMYCWLITSFTFNIFVLCYIGDLLTEQCENIGEVAYSVNWYNMSGKEARNFVMIVALAQYPVILTAGKMANLSLQNFANVLKASLSYLNVLRTVTTNSD